MTDHGTVPAFAHIIYTDGACSGNPGPGGWGTIVAHSLLSERAQVRELGGAVAPTTNNKMELHSVIEGLRWIQDEPGPTVILTDSVYVIRGATQWVWGWKKRGWKNAAGEPVANQDHWESLSQLTAERKRIGPIEWRYVRGHQGTDGNERCDEIAVAFSKSQAVTLYSGCVEDYQFLIQVLPPFEPLPEMKSRATAGSVSLPVSYLSLIDGQVLRHATWSECEARVKGRSGAKFKKVATPDQEKVVLQSWGVDASAIRSK